MQNQLMIYNTELTIIHTTLTKIHIPSTLSLLLTTILIDIQSIRIFEFGSEK